MKKRIILGSFAILVLCGILLIVNTYREKTVYSIISRNITNTTKIELIENETIIKTITDKQIMNDIIKNIGKTKIKRALEQPSLIVYSRYKYIQFWNNDKVILQMTFDNGRGNIYIGHTEYHLISDEISISKFKNIINR